MGTLDRSAMRLIVTLTLAFVLLPRLATSPSSRNLGQMADLVSSHTNCSFFELLTLTRYNNWCGLGDNGEPPKDSLDACCEEHDNCYGDIQDTGLCLPHPLMEDYLWTMDNDTLSCGVCKQLNNSTMVNKEAKDESLFQKIYNFFSWK